MKISEKISECKRDLTIQFTTLTVKHNKYSKENLKINECCAFITVKDDKYIKIIENHLTNDKTVPKSTNNYTKRFLKTKHTIN